MWEIVNTDGAFGEVITERRPVRSGWLYRVLVYETADMAAHERVSPRNCAAISVSVAFVPAPRGEKG